MDHFLPNEIWIEILKYNHKDIFKMGQLDKKWQLWFKNIYKCFGQYVLSPKYKKLPSTIDRIFKLHCLFGDDANLDTHYSKINKYALQQSTPTSEIKYSNILHSDLISAIRNHFPVAILNNDHKYVKTALMCPWIKPPKLKNFINVNTIDNCIKEQRVEMLELLTNYLTKIDSKILRFYYVNFLDIMQNGYSGHIYKILDCIKNNNIKCSIRSCSMEIWKFAIKNNCIQFIDYLINIDRHVLLNNSDLVQLLYIISRYYSDLEDQFDIHQIINFHKKHGIILDINYNNGIVLYNAMNSNDILMVKALLKYGADRYIRNGKIFREAVINRPGDIDTLKLEKVPDNEKERTNEIIIQYNEMASLFDPAYIHKSLL